jgi:hypothetical protein
MKGNNEMADTTTDSNSAPDAGTAPPSRRRPGPKPIRWNAEKAETLRRDVAAISENAAALEDARSTAAPGDPGGVDDLGPAAYVAAADSMAQEATQRQDVTADGDDEPENTEPPDTAYVDAFAPPTVEPDNTEPEIAARDQRYREQLRETEADRDRLSGLVETMQRSEIERLASPRLADPRDLWYRDASVEGLLDENGAVDPVKVDAAVTDLLEAHAHWASPRAAYRGELRSGASERPIEPKGKRWSDAFAPGAE